MTPLIAVLGATGNVGSAVASTLIQKGATVRVLGRRRTELRARFARAEAVRLDLSDRNQFAAALEGVTGLFVIRPPAAHSVDDALMAFLETAERAGVQHVVFSSVAGAGEQTWLPHAKIERHLTSLRMKWTLLRPGFFLQNLEDAYRRDIRRDDRIYVPAGDAQVAWIDARDVGEAGAVCLLDPDTHAGRAYHLTGSQALGFDEIARILTDVLGRDIRYDPAAIPAYAVHLLVRHQLGLIQTVVQTYLHADLRRGTATPVTPDLEQVLGHAPRSARDYIQDRAARLK